MKYGWQGGRKSITVLIEHSQREGKLQQACPSQQLLPFKPRGFSWNWSKVLSRHIPENDKAPSHWRINKDAGFISGSSRCFLLPTPATCRARTTPREWLCCCVSLDPYLRPCSSTWTPPNISARRRSWILFWCDICNYTCTDVFGCSCWLRLHR